MTNIAEDIYTITSVLSKKSIELDLTTPFVLNSAATIINVPFEDITIKNSIGTIVAEIKKEELLTIVEDPDTYYFVNLVDILFEPLVVEGYKYSKLYPLRELADDEYGLKNGMVVTGKDVIVNVSGYELLKTEVDVNKVVNYTNGNYVKRLDDDFTYYNEQIINGSDIYTIIKLDNVSIERGSLILEEYNNNSGEDYTSTPEDERRFLNVNTEDTPMYVIVDEDNPNNYLQE